MGTECIDVAKHPLSGVEGAIGSKTLSLKYVDEQHNLKVRL